MRGRGDCLIEGAPASVQQDVALFRDLSAQRSDEFAAQIWISLHVP
jgi:hypothetical protein